MSAISGSIEIEARILELSPDISGVYFLLLAGEVVYIGQSETVVMRVMEHRRRQLKEFDCAAYIEASVSELDAVEGAFIRAFRPKLNRGCPMGTPWFDEEILARYCRTENPRQRRDNPAIGAAVQRRH